MNNRVLLPGMTAPARRWPRSGTSKAPTLKRLDVTRRTATLPATVRDPETATVDDALGLPHALVASRP